MMNGLFMNLIGKGANVLSSSVRSFLFALINWRYAGPLVQTSEDFIDFLMIPRQIRNLRGFLVLNISQ